MTTLDRKRQFTTESAAQELGVESWRVRRVLELHLVSDPPRLGRQRVIDEPLLGEIAAALRNRGWLND